MQQIDLALSKGSVIVYCRQGANRSGAVVAKYVCCKTGCHIKDVDAYMKLIRPIFDISEGFKEHRGIPFHCIRVMMDKLNNAPPGIRKVPLPDFRSIQSVRTQPILFQGKLLNPAAATSKAPAIQLKAQGPPRPAKLTAGPGPSFAPPPPFAPPPAWIAPRPAWGNNAASSSSAAGSSRVSSTPANLRQNTIRPLASTVPPQPERPVPGASDPMPAPGTVQVKIEPKSPKPVQPPDATPFFPAPYPAPAPPSPIRAPPSLPAAPGPLPSSPASHDVIHPGHSLTPKLT